MLIGNVPENDAKKHKEYRAEKYIQKGNVQRKKRKRISACWLNGIGFVKCTSFVLPENQPISPKKNTITAQHKHKQKPLLKRYAFRIFA